MRSFFPTLLLFRFRQAWRALASAGWLLLLALPMGLIFLLATWERAGTTEPAILLLIVGGSLLALHWQRRDLAFLSKCDIRVPWIVVGEYQLLLFVLLTLPVWLITHHWEGSLWCHLAAAAIAWIPVRRIRSSGTFLALAWIPPALFEWKSGIRKQWMVLLPVYLAGLASSVFVVGPLASFLLILLAVPGFYNELEARPLLERSLRPGFLITKWLTHSAFLLALFTPHLLLFLIFHLQYWYLMGVLLLIGCLLLGCAIFYKYSAYRPQRQFADNQTPMGLLYLCVIIPFFAPAVPLACLLLYHRARKRLHYFFAHA